jgi:micrococcal nuclease
MSIMNPSHLYHYKAYVTRIYSGDSCRVDIDLGMDTWTRGIEIRLHRIRAPEVKGKSRDAGLRARDHLRHLIMDKEILLRTIKDRGGKPRGYLGEMTVVSEDGNTINVSEAMVTAGHAVYKNH